MFLFDTGGLEEPLRRRNTEEITTQGEPNDVVGQHSQSARRKVLPEAGEVTVKRNRIWIQNKSTRNKLMILLAGNVITLEISFVFSHPNYK